MVTAIDAHMAITDLEDFDPSRFSTRDKRTFAPLEAAEDLYDHLIDIGECDLAAELWTELRAAVERLQAWHLVTVSYPRIGGIGFHLYDSLGH